MTITSVYRCAHMYSPSQVDHRTTHDQLNSMVLRMPSSTLSAMRLYVSAISLYVCIYSLHRAVGQEYICKHRSSFHTFYSANRGVIYTFAHRWASLQSGGIELVFCVI